MVIGRQELIFNDRGLAIGFSKFNGTTIEYHTYRYGIVGEYNPNTRQYRRFKTDSNHPYFPLNHNDYGTADVVYWSEN